jgi:SAM-dependent methyltransferase
MIARGQGAATIASGADGGTDGMAASAFECMQCGGQAGTLKLADCWDHYLGKPYRADYVRCDACELVQQSPVPENVGDFYDAYPIHQKKSALYRVMRALVMKASYFDVGGFLSGWKGAGRPLIVDFGCGDGWFLKECEPYPVDRVGYELDPTVAAHIAREIGVPIYSSEAKIVAEQGGKADVATMHFVVEHVTDLNRTFEVIASLLKPGGLFYFVVPNISSWEAKLFGKAWHNLDCPRHVSFPEEKAVRQLAERWGFTFQSEKNVPFPNGIAGSVPVVLTGKYRTPLFLASLPFGILLSRLFPSGNTAFRLIRA